MYHRRRPHSSSAPPPPSTSALIAASTVYHPSNNSPSLAAAAAGAALRHASASPTPIDQRTGSIPTKRMLKRRDSYSSVISDSDGGVTFGLTGRPGVHRTGSLTDRRFRKDRPGRRGSREAGAGRRGSADMASERTSAPTSRAAKATETDKAQKGGIWGREEVWEESNGEYAADDDSGSGDHGGVGFGRTTSLRSNSSSTRSSPTTMRGSIKTKKHQRSASASIFNRIRDTSTSSSGGSHRRRNSDSDVPGSKHKNTHNPPLSSAGIARLSSGDYGDSVSSLQSELESIAEGSPTSGGHLRKIPTQILEEDSEDDLWGSDTFDFQKKGVGGKTRDIGLRNRKGRSASSPPHLLSVPSDIPRDTPQSHTTLTGGDAILGKTLPKHSPPLRSVSPAKSALKHAPASPAVSATGVFGKAYSDAASVKKARVSFSDEDSIASFTAYSRPPLMGMPDDGPRRLPVFGSVSRGTNTGSNNGGLGFGTSVPRTMGHAVLAPSPPPSDSSQESIIGLESALRYPRGQPPLGAAVAVKKLLGVDGDEYGDGNVGSGVRLRKGPLTPPETRAGVPELKLTAPTPREEKDEVEGSLGGLNLEGLPGGFPGTGSTARQGVTLEELSGSSPAERSLGAIRDTRAQESAQKDEGEDSSDSGNSIYSDAYEDLAPLNTTNLPDILEVVPLSAVRQRNDSSSSSDPPPAPRSSLPAQLNPPTPEFLVPKTRRRAQSTPVQRQYSSSSSTVSFSEDDEDDDASLSESSFRRARPREKRVGMMTSMRTGSKQLTKSSTESTGGMRTSLRTDVRSKSRFSADSDSEVEVGEKSALKSRFDKDSDDEVTAVAATGLGGMLRKSRTDSVDTVRKMVRKKGFWGKVFKGKKGKGTVVNGKGKGRESVVEEGLAEKEMEAGVAKGAIVKKTKTPEKGAVWTGGTDRVRTVVSTGSPEKEMGFEKEVGVGLEGRPVIGYLKKRKRFWRLRRLLGLDIR